MASSGVSKRGQLSRVGPKKTSMPGNTTGQGRGGGGGGGGGKNLGVKRTKVTRGGFVYGGGTLR